MLNFEPPTGNYASSSPSDYQIKQAWSGTYYKVYSSRGWEGSFRDLCDAALFIKALENLEESE
jgi:hypothetical protein